MASTRSPFPATADDAVYVEPASKRVRARFDGEIVVDTVDARLVWEIPYYPQYYIPIDDVAAAVLEPSSTVGVSDLLGPVEYHHVVGARRRAEDAAWRHPSAEPTELQSYIRFDWKAMDAWFEEDVEVYLHPRNPYTRVDVLDSSRNVRVEIDGVTVAESDHASFLFETRLPTRYYLPKTDVRFDLLTPTDTVTACPYKGWARYWSAEVNGVTHDDIVWGYDAPLAESAGVAGLVCFYTERVDVFIDGEPAPGSGSAARP